MKWRCEADHAFSTPKLRIKKERERERERETTFLRDSKNPKSREHKGQRITLSYRPNTHRNPFKDIYLPRDLLFRKGLNDSQSYVLIFTNVDS